ncbi:MULTISPECIES: serine hydrolase domain-containing protein [Streptomyces]|uniref:Serine hydrolase domain-containing protein n=1 Tax=Streptomyces luteosporeus TaxID=173856 RepID=A0ABP6GMI0_9ACTN
MTATRPRRTPLGIAVTAALAATTLTTTALTTTATAAPARAQDRHAATRAVMEEHVRAGLPGVLGGTREQSGGRTLAWNASAGVADLASGRKRQERDHFRIGSISKVFTSVVLLQLEDEGRLDLDDTVEKYLPGVVHGNGHDGNRITLRQLLNHTSGIYNYTQDPAFRKELTQDFTAHRYETRTPAQLVATAMRHAPSFSPGEPGKWEYSNTNYILAGMVVEKVTGHSYASEIERRILRKLGLHQTSLPGTSPWMPDPSGRAYSKIPGDPEGRTYDVTELNMSWGWAAGEIISTTGDLNRFYGALLGGELLPERRQRELLTTVPANDGGSVGYGLGVETARLSCGKDVWFHSGGVHGSVSLAAATPDGRHTAAFNVNGDWAAIDLQALLESEYCGTRPPAGKGSGPAPERLLSPR